MGKAKARRRDALAALGRDPLDVLAVGGGINGAGIARDAAMRGLRVGLVERGDLASGTSSRSSKLIHGGLRYLEQGDVRLVLEAVRERERLQRLAPHLVRPQEFVFPLYRGGPLGPLKLAAGLWAYDLLAGFWNVRWHRMLSPKAVAEAEPALLRDGLCGAGQYWDCRTDDARLVLETALSAAAEGALIVSYAEVAGFVKEDGRIVGARVVDRLGRGEVVARARVVVNAARPWVDRVVALDAPETPARLAPADVVSAFAGLRSLVAPRGKATMSPSAVSREEEVFSSAPGLISIAGGKLTTYRLVAKAVVDRAVDALPAAGDRRPFPRSRTGEVPLPGGAAPEAALAAAALSRDGHGVAPAVIDHLAGRYGSRLDEVLGLVARDQRLGEPIVAGLPDPRAEVVEAVEREWAFTLEDVMRRRTQVALRDASAGAAAADDVAALMARPPGWDEETSRAAARGYVEAAEAVRRRWR